MMEKKEQEVLAQRAKGMRDIGDVKAKKRLYIKDTLSKIFRKYGFSHLETPISRIPFARCASTSCSFFSIIVVVWFIQFEI